MANTAKKAILKALIESVLYELYPRTIADNVLMPDGITTLAAKLSEMVIAINERAKTTDMNTAISGAVNDLRQEMLGDTPVEAYNTFTELAAYIAEHKDVADALTAAVGEKADKKTVEALQAAVDGLGALAKKSTVSETDLDAALREKINAGSQGNHSHSNKSLLDTYTQTEANLKSAVQLKHSHSNKSVLDGISAAKVTEWNGKGRFIPSATRPADLKSGDLWAELVE